MGANSFEVIAASAIGNSVGAFVGGLVIVLALVWAVRLGIGVRRRESRPPRAAEQPKLPATGAVHEIQEAREPDEMPHTANGERLMPYELHAASTKRSGDQRHRQWSPGSSGGFGSGGPGHT
ncbi:DUF6479 family protein [Streptomyces sp. NPDC090306]|uniref:DUF6479 family protein n=1 Tax=unclassified Streptomyces TaxID=2593676 RepID=UPI0036E8F37C